MTTAILTNHARERCQQMGIGTKVAKRIVANAEVVYPEQTAQGTDPQHIMFWSGEPLYSVVVADCPNGPVVLTVLFRRKDDYATCPARRSA